MIVPRATYRLQFRDGMDFAAAAALAPYLERLGVSHVYASPVFAARSGSTHGYDATDFNRLEPVLGGMTEFERMVEALKRHDLGLILDFVPNHMAASIENPWWRDVLQHGQGSPFAAFFDIDWAGGGGRLLLPVLGEPYGRVLEMGELCLVYEGEEFFVRYYDHRFPVAPDSAAELSGDPGAAAEAISSGRERLHRLLEVQHYRLCHWRLAPDGLNYRRFFDINDLVAIRVEQPEVFEQVHGLVLQLISDRMIDGLRLDHIDGLTDPAGYLEHLQEHATEANGGEPFYLLVEKILGPDETLRRNWPVAGTTGYEFANQVTALQVEEAGLAELTSAYRDFTGDQMSFEATAKASKRLILRLSFSGDLSSLVGAAFEIAQTDINTRDITAEALRRAITEIVVAFPVYRTYVTGSGPAPADLDTIEAVCAVARRRLGQETEEALSLVCRFMRGEEPEHAEFAMRLQRFTGPVMAKSIEDTAFYRYLPLLSLNEVGGEPAGELCSVGRFHELNRERLQDWPHNLLATSTHDTKRGEDARARLNVLSHHPRVFAEAVARWWSGHQPLRRQAGDRLAPDPKEAWLFYQSLIGIWPFELDPADADGLAELSDRLTVYMRKAMREAKERTRWTDVDEDYEAAVLGFVAAALDAEQRVFLAEVAAFVEQLAAPGAVNSLAQVLLKLTAPGVPDLYQGTESWDLSLVDPDNRRPVAFAGLAQALAQSAHERVAHRLSAWRGSGVKQAVIQAVLSLRKRQPDLFSSGKYQPLRIEGDAGGLIVAYARRHGRRAIIVCVPRDARLARAGNLPALDTTRLAGSRLCLDEPFAAWDWQDVFGGIRRERGSRVRLDDLLSPLPVALLYHSG